MIAQIGEHGEMIAAQLENNKEVASMKELQEQQTKERILDAILDVAGSIEAGHEAVADSLDVGQERIADTLTAGHTKISETLTTGHNKLAETGADIATAIIAGDQKMEAAISQTGESLDLIKTGTDTNSLELKTELDQIEAAITAAQSRDVQVATIRRLADKMECTTDCFTSDDQADAIVRGLARTDLNMRDLVDDINNYASNGREADIERRQLVPSLVESRLVRGLVRQGGAPADPGCYEAACEADSPALLRSLLVH